MVTYSFTKAMINHRRSRNAGYPASPAQIPACGIPAPGSSVIITRAERSILTQAPDSFSPACIQLAPETHRSSAPSSVLPRSDYAFGSFDSAICTVPSLLPGRISTTTRCYHRHKNSCNAHAPYGSSSGSTSAAGHAGLTSPMPGRL